MSRHNASVPHQPRNCNTLFSVDTDTMPDRGLVRDHPNPAPPSPIPQSVMQLQRLPSYSPERITTPSLSRSQDTNRFLTPETPYASHDSLNLHSFYGSAPPTPSRHPGTPVGTDSVMYLAPSRSQSSAPVDWDTFYANNPYASAPPTPYWIPMSNSDGFMADDDSIVMLNLLDRADENPMPSPPTTPTHSFRATERTKSRR